MNSTPLWLPLAVAGIGLLGTIVGTVTGVLIAQRRSDRREREVWQRERDRERQLWAHEDALGRVVLTSLAVSCRPHRKPTSERAGLWWVRRRRCTHRCNSSRPRSTLKSLKVFLRSRSHCCRKGTVRFGNSGCRIVVVLAHPPT